MSAQHQNSSDQPSRLLAAGKAHELDNYAPGVTSVDRTHFGHLRQRSAPLGRISKKRAYPSPSQPTPVRNLSIRRRLLQYCRSSLPALNPRTSTAIPPSRYGPGCRHRTGRYSASQAWHGRDSEVGAPFGQRRELHSRQAGAACYDGPLVDDVQVAAEHAASARSRVAAIERSSMLVEYQNFRARHRFNL